MFSFAFFLCFIDHVFLVSDFRQMPRWNFLEFVPFLYHCCIYNRYFHCEKCAQDCSGSLNSFLFLQYDLHDLMKSSFHSLSRRFIGFNDACVFCPAIIQNITNFLVLSSGSAKHCCWHRNFLFSMRILHHILKLSIIRINQINTTQFHCIVDLRFFGSPLLLT